MFSLNPEKLFIVFIVAMVLLGPDKLPKLARQVGTGWAKVKAFQERMESEVRETMPDLPSSRDIARMARPPRVATGWYRIRPLRPHPGTRAPPTARGRSTRRPLPTPRPPMAPMAITHRSPPSCARSGSPDTRSPPTRE